jgi:hypothetical protein
MYAKPLFPLTPFRISRIKATEIAPQESQQFFTEAKWLSALCKQQS